MTDAYREFLARKAAVPLPSGLDEVPELHPSLLPHQRDGVTFAVRRGRAALFHGTGLGKTRQQIEWARITSAVTGAPALILAPLAVAAQTVREGAALGIEVTRCYGQDDVRPGINVTNYDRLDKFRPGEFGAVVLDESSILKNFTGSTKRALCESFKDTPYRLCCTATPAPNDYMEIGNHSEFLGIMPGTEMLSRWFVTDTMNLGKYRLKGHAVASFWDWVSSWARCVSRPSDLGYSDHGYALPPLVTHRHVLSADLTIDTGEHLFRMPVMSATQLHREKRLSAPARADAVATLVRAEPAEPWLVWCDTDYEADAIKIALPEAVEVRGSMPVEKKERLLDEFSTSKAKVLVTKPSVAGFGMNWQHCARVVFAGISYSYEQYYQAIRRCWRYGQNREVHVHVLMSETEAPVWAAVSRKSEDHVGMKREMLAATKRAAGREHTVKVPYEPNHQGRLPSWLAA